MTVTAFPIEAFRQWDPSRPKSIPRTQLPHARRRKPPVPLRSSPSLPYARHAPVPPHNLGGQQNNQRHPLPARPPAEVCVHGNSRSDSRQRACPEQGEEPVSALDKSPADSAMRIATSPQAQTPSGSPALDRNLLYDVVTNDISVGSPCSIQGAAECRSPSASSESSVRQSPGSHEPTIMPIDPVILTDEFPLESSQLYQGIQDGDTLWSSQREISCPYPEPPTMPQTTFYNDHLSLGLTEYPDNHAENDGTSLQGPQLQQRSHDVNRTGQRKRPSTGPNGRIRQRNKRQKLEETTPSPAGNSCDSLRFHFLSLPTTARLEFLSWLFEGALPRCTFDPDIAASVTPSTKKVNTGVRKQVRWATPQGNAGILDGNGSFENSRKGIPWLPEEESLLLELRNTRRLPWSDVTRLFSDQYPGRSQGSIQVYWSTKLKGRQS